MTLSQSLEEAKLLKSIINNVYEKIYTMPKFNESEIELRAQTLRGVVLVLQSDLIGIINDWNAELIQTK